MEKRMLAVGTVLMLFLGLIYAWSLFAAPLEEAFGWSRAETSRTFSVSMASFCLGNVASSVLLRRRQPRDVVLLSAVLFLSGFFLASRISGIWGLYLSYGALCGLGVGLGYNAILSTVPRWFPDRPGFATGTLLMGMGLGSLVLGAAVRRIMETLRWDTAFKILSGVFFVLFFLGSTQIAGPEKKRGSPEGEGRTLGETLGTRDFWMVFIWATIASAVGLGIVGSAAYMAAEVGVSAAALPLVVGMVSVGNGLGRLSFGAAADKFGAKRAMAIANLVFASGLALASLAGLGGIPAVMAAGFVLVGAAYGAPSTLSAAFVKKEFGNRHYPENLSAVILVLIPASIIGPSISASVFERWGHYLPVYYLLLALSILAFLPLGFLEKKKGPLP